MLYNKVRPNKFTELVGQRNVVKNLMAQSQKDKFFNIYILCGQYGSGKTTVARILAMALNCEHKDEQGNPCLECESCKAILEKKAADVIEIDAASNNSIDNVRDIINTVQYMPRMKKKVYIIDEVHRLSKQAFDCLLKTFEEPPEHAVFILCTTEDKSLPDTITSRAPVYTFNRLSDEDICARLEEIAKKEGYAYNQDGIYTIAQYSKGAMRNALSLLEQLAIQGEITEESVRSLLGLNSFSLYENVFNALLDKDVNAVISFLREYTKEGKNVVRLIDDLQSVLCNALIKNANRTFVIPGSQQSVSVVSKMAEKPVEDIMGIMKLLLAIKEKLGADVSIDNCIVVFLSELTRNNVEKKVQILEDKVAELEEKISNFKATDNALVATNVPAVEIKTSATCEITQEHTDGFEATAEDECPFETTATPVEIVQVEETKTETVNSVVETSEPVSSVTTTGMGNLSIPFGAMAEFGFPF